MAWPHGLGWDHGLAWSWVVVDHGLTWVMGWHESWVGMGHGTTWGMGQRGARDSVGQLLAWDGTGQGLAWAVSWHAGGPSTGWQEEAAWGAHPLARPSSSGGPARLGQKAWQDTSTPWSATPSWHSLRCCRATGHLGDDFSRVGHKDTNPPPGLPTNPPVATRRVFMVATHVAVLA